MVFLIGASCLDNAFNSLERLKQKGLKRNILAIRGLSLNPQALDHRKKLQNFLLRSKTEKLVVWHDVISNSISKHRSNSNRPCQIKKTVGHSVFVQEQNRSYFLRPTGKLSKHPAKVEEHGDSYSGRGDAPHVISKKEQREFHC